jgi:hypothetical protein
MWRSITVLLLVLALPASVSAGPIKAAAEKAGRDLGRAEQGAEARSRGRFWSGIGLLAGGGVLAALGSFELGDDEVGPDDGEDFDESDDGEDADGWGNKALIGSGIAAAAVGSLLLWTGRESRPSVAIRPGRVSVRQTLRF